MEAELKIGQHIICEELGPRQGFAVTIQFEFLVGVDETLGPTATAAQDATMNPASFCNNKALKLLSLRKEKLTFPVELQMTKQLLKKERSTVDSSWQFRAKHNKKALKGIRVWPLSSAKNPKLPELGPPPGAGCRIHGNGLGVAGKEGATGRAHAPFLLNLLPSVGALEL
ncbi:hypothetical protein mRhiFer1_007976 [Rhinolophus ferrumequinum]|uniref:Uncharacterized protein n=1 Tax=Rhinolophus ferrumequinum TaxID=59479 RepID=A0A7J8AWB5_RHIFE|nr:hypothetical protein mRhiFer1_007976 [Rhinolophus ferrumequinum]